MLPTDLSPKARNDRTAMVALPCTAQLPGGTKKDRTSTNLVLCGDARLPRTYGQRSSGPLLLKVLPFERLDPLFYLRHPQ